MGVNFGGRRVAGYLLEDRLGSGSAGAVYRAYQAQLDRWVAVKVLDVGSAGDQDFLQRFRQETQAVASLHHPNILGLHDYGEDGGIAFIVMEYVPGGALDQVLAEGAMPVERALGLTLPIGQALAYAHGEGMVHRDLKPTNVLLPRPDWPLVVDFGLAGVLSAQVSVMHSSVVTRPVSYLSPEQVSGEPADERTDIYSLGLMLFEMLTGRLPFTGKSAAQSMMRRMREDAPSPLAFDPSIPVALEAVVQRALARDPRARYAQMSTFVGDLQSATADLDSGPAAPAVPAGHSITMQLSLHQEIEGPRLFIATSGVALPVPGDDEVLVGRTDPTQSSSPDINLEPYGGGSAGVSRHHSRLLHRPDGWYVEDLRSTNGTYLNEVRLLPSRPVRVRSGDLLRFGQMTLVFEEA